MNPSPPDADDAKLRVLLQQAHPAPTLPPRFQEDVWRRLDQAQRPRAATAPRPWLEWIFPGIRHPAYAAVGAGLVILAGAVWGTEAGTDQRHRADQVRYLAAVSPFQHPAP